MPIYDRSAAGGFEVVDEWSRGFGWLAHPDEGGERVGHAVRHDGAVWLLDPLDAAGIDERITGLGSVAGVVVCSNWHARDAGVFAERHGVAVHAPTWLSRIEDLVDAPIERFSDGIAGFDSDRFAPLPGWEEALLYRERDGTLYSPDVLSRLNAVGSERIGVTLPMRPRPPRDRLAEVEPERLLSGHGRGVELEATAALRTALEGARVRLPRALYEQTGPTIAGIVRAVSG